MVTLKQGTKDGLNLASDTLKASVSQTFTMSYHTDKWIVFQADKLNARVCLMKKMSSVLNDLLIRVDDLVN